jgi:hypothetical protein
MRESLLRANYRGPEACLAAMSFSHGFCVANLPRESSRDIETCLRSISGKLYHMGFHGTIARSTLAGANESRDGRIYADFAQTLIAIARPLYAHDPIGVELNQSVYALDSTTTSVNILDEFIPEASAFHVRKGTGDTRMPGCLPCG